MEEKPLKEEAKSLSPYHLVKSGLKSDIRNLWTKATLSQLKLNVQLTNVHEEDSGQDSLANRKSGQWYKQKADSESAWEGWSERNNEGGTRPEALELEQSPRISQRNDVQGGEYFRSKMELASSVSSLNILKHTHHRAYWVEQQNRLPLPLMELMENEALEILTKALQSYQSAIGREHFLTKQLQRYIESLKKRRNRRQHVSAH